MELKDRIRNVIEKHIDDLFSELRVLNDNEPMDGDQTEHIADMMLARLDWCNGNISTDEYYNIIS